MIRRIKRARSRWAVPHIATRSSEELKTSSPDDLREIIGELEAQIAEHETTNEFLRDLLTQQWFNAPLDEFAEARSLERL